jgi:hypothetical protein
VHAPFLVWHKAVMGRAHVLARWIALAGVVASGCEKIGSTRTSTTVVPQPASSPSPTTPAERAYQDRVKDAEWSYVTALPSELASMHAPTDSLGVRVTAVSAGQFTLTVDWPFDAKHLADLWGWKNPYIPCSGGDIEVNEVAGAPTAGAAPDSLAVPTMGAWEVHAMALAPPPCTAWWAQDVSTQEILIDSIHFDRTRAAALSGLPAAVAAVPDAAHLSALIATLPTGMAATPSGPASFLLSLGSGMDSAYLAAALGLVHPHDVCGELVAGDTPSPVHFGRWTVGFYLPRAAPCTKASSRDLIDDPEAVTALQLSVP